MPVFMLCPTPVLARDWILLAAMKAARLADLLKSQLVTGGLV